MKKTAALAENIQDHWNELSHLFSVHNKEEYDKAIQDYTKALKIDPQIYDAYIGLGQAYYSKGEYNLAISNCITR